MKRFYLLIAAITIQFSLISQVNLDSLLIGYWPFNGNGLDESSFSNDAVNNGCVLTSDHFGIADNAYSFSGSDYFEIPSSYDELTIPFSISAWVYNEEVSQHHHIFSSSSIEEYYQGVYLGVNLNGQAQITYTDGGIIGSESRRTLNTI